MIKISSVKFAVLSLLLLGTNLAFGQTIGQFTFTNATSGCSALSASSVPSNVTISNIAPTGVSCAVSTAPYVYRTTDYSTSTTIDNTTYLEFTVTAAAGYKVTITGFSAKLTRNTNGPQSVRFAHNNTGSFNTTFDVSPTTAASVYTWSSFSSMTTTSGGSVKFRIIGWNATSTTPRRLEADDITLTGTVTRDQTVIGSSVTGLAVSPLGASQTNQALLGWSLTNASAPSFTDIVITTSSDISSGTVLNNVLLYKSTDNDFSTAGDNVLVTSNTPSVSSTSITINGISGQTLAGSPSYYFLVADIDPSVSNSTPNLQLSFAYTDVTVSAGTVSVTPASVTGTDYAFVGTPIVNITQTYFDFGNIPLGSPSASQSVDVTGYSLSGDIIITPPTGYEIRIAPSGTFSNSAIHLTPVSGSVATTTIDVRFNPSAPGYLDGNLNFSSAGATTQSIYMEGIASVSEPTTQPTLTVGTITGTTIQLNISGGNGEKYLLAVRQGSAVNDVPSDNTNYLANPNFLDGSQLGSGNYVVLASSATTVTVTGLSGNTTYYFAVFSYNDGGVAGAENYLTTSPGLANATTTGAIYVWNASGTNSWTTASNWTPSRGTPSASDILEFNAGNTVVVTGVPTETVAQVLISNNTNVTLQANSGGAILTVSGDTGTDIDVPSGSTLSVSGTDALIISLSSGATASVDGTMDLGSNQINSTGSITITGTFKTAASSGFTGSSSTALSNTLTSVTVGTSSTIEYNSGSSQTVTVRSDYANLTLSGVGTKTLPGSTISVQKDFTVSAGSISVTSGNVMQFNGANAQNISGISFRDVTFDGGNTKTLTSAASVSGIVNFSGNTTLASGGSLTLTSDASSTGRIGQITDASTVTGNVTVQRYIPAGGRVWYNLASPVSGTTISEWQSGAPITGIYITGPFTGASAPTGVGITSTGVSMDIWNASTGAYSAYPTSSSSEPITNGVGYRTFVRDGNASYNGGATTAKTIHSTGSLVIGDKTFTLNYSATGGTPAGGWNLLGNPYASDISANLNNSSAWNTSSANLASTAVYTSNSASNNYNSCNGGIGSGCTISSSHAFWVQTNAGGGSLVLHEGAKSNTSTTLQRQAAPNYYKVSMYPIAYPTAIDELYVRYDADATKNFDPSLDAYELAVAGTGSAAYEQISSINNGIYYSIVARPDYLDADTVNLNISGVVGQNVMDFSAVQTFNSGVTIYLWDKFLNTITDVSAQPVYNFDIISGNAASTGTRFSIINTKQQVVTPVVDAGAKGSIYAYPNPSTDGQDITINGSAAGKNYTVVVYSNSGNKVYEKTGINGSILVSGSSFTSGLYMIKVISADGGIVFTEKFIKE